MAFDSVKMWSSVILCFIIAFSSCNGVIYHLNDSEYYRMPHLYHLDGYESCLAEDGGLYCLLKLDLQEGAHSDLMNMIREYSLHKNKHLNHSYLQRGVCVTRTCEDFMENRNVEEREVLYAVLEECMNSSIWKEYKLEAKLSKVYYCDEHNEQTDVDTADCVVAGVLLVLILLVAVGTVCDVNCNPAEVNSIGLMLLINFSLRKNWRTLVSSHSSDPRRQKLKGLHGLRSISNCLTMISHALFFYMIGFQDNTHDIEKSYEKIHFQVIYNGMAVVQLFFVMSAFLLAYIMHVHSETKVIKWSDLPMLLLGRWWRLTPSYAALLAFTATWLRHVGSGPLWKLHVSNSVVSDCRRFWWYHLVYFNNYQPEDQWCAIQTWHVASDTQLYVITMLVYIATVSRGRSVAFAILLLVGIVAPALHVWLQDLGPFVFLYPELLRAWENRTFALLHVRGHNNLSCYVIGLAAGTLVYNMHKKNLDLSKFKRWGVLSWLLIPATVCLFLAGGPLYGDGPPASLAVNALYAGLHRVPVGLIFAMMMVSVTMRLSDSLNNILEWDGWLATSRLGYSVYLVHMNLVHILIGIRTQLTIVSLLYLIVMYFGLVVMSVILALPLYLMVEAPAMGLLSMYFKSRYRTELQKTGKKAE